MLIFFNNSIKNGLLLIALDEDSVDKLFQLATLDDPLIVTVNLDRQTIETNAHINYDFSIEPSIKQSLIDGSDDISLTLQYKDEILRYEQFSQKKILGVSLSIYKLSAISLSLNFWILPVEVFGSSVKTTFLGALKCAIESLQYLIISSSVKFKLSGLSVTNAHGVSPHFSSDFATTAASRMLGCL